MRTGSEIKVGVITLLAIALLLVYTFSIREYRAGAATYAVCVIFDNARGLQRGDPVRMVGVKIGEVRTVEINPKRKAEVTLAVDGRYELYENYKFQIATAGLIQERFVEVVPGPPDPYSAKLKDGVSVDGVLTPDLADLVAAGSEVLENLNRTSHRLNVVLADQQILTGMKRALQSFSQAARAAADLATTTSALTQDSRPEILATLRGLRSAAADLQSMTAKLRGRLARGATIDDLEETTRQAREAAANAASVTAALADLISDPEVQQQFRATLSAVHDAAQSAKRVGTDLEVFSGELRQAAPAIPRVAREAEDVVETSAALRQRIKPPEINAAFDVLYSGDADRSFSSGRLDFQTTEERFLRIGVDDIGEESNVNFQIGDRQRRADIRYGLIRSCLGIGLDFGLPHETTLSLDVFDPNDLRVDILADVPFVLGRSDWSVLLGARDLGDEELFLGGIRLRR